MKTKWRTDLSERDEKIVSMYESGKTYQQIADIMGLTKSRVHQIADPWVEVRHYGEERRRIRDLKIREAFERIASGNSTIAEEAEAIGVLPDTLATNFRHRGLVPPKKETQLHGTRYRYQCGCRCEECRDAMRAAQQELRRRPPPNHGTPSGYFNYGCKCVPCRKAGSIHNRQRRIERMKRLAETN